MTLEQLQETTAATTTGMTASQMIVLGTLIVYLVGMIVIGIISRRAATKSYTDMQISGKTMPFHNIFFSFTAATMGTGTFVGAIASGWSEGVSYTWQSFTMSSILMAFLFVPYLSRMTRITLAEPIGERFGMSARLAVSGLAFSRTLGSCAAQVTGMGMVLSVMTGLPVITGILTAFAVTTFYTMVGQRYATRRAETIQAVIMWFCLIFGPFLSLAMVGNGSISGGMTKIFALPARYLDWSIRPVPVIIGLAFSQTFGQFLQPHIYSSFYGAKTAKMACFAAYTGGAFMGMNSLGNIITGLSARAAGLVVPVRDMTSSAWYLQYGPLWFAAIFCTGVFAAGMSTMAAQQMAMSANILTDFIFGWKRKILNMKQAYRMSMFVIAFFGGIAVWWSIAWQDVLNIIIYSYEVLVSSLIVAFFGCFFFPRMTNKGVTMGAISGGFVAIFWQFVIKAYYNTMLPAGFLRDMPSVLPALSTCIILNLIGTYTSKPDYEKTIEFAKVYSLNRLQARAEAALAKYKGGATQ